MNRNLYTEPHFEILYVNAIDVLKESKPSIDLPDDTL